LIPPALELIGLRAGYGQIEVLRGVDLVVPAGSVVVLLGANGAGKTTTMKVVDGRHRQTSGCVHVAGQHLAAPSAGTLARAGVCSIPEGRGVFPNLTVEENLRLVTYARDRLPVTDVEERAFARFPVLKQRRTQLAGTMSGGEQQMLAMGRGLMQEPLVLMIDELSLGLAPVLAQQLFLSLKALRKQGLTIVLVEQNVHLALALSDYTYVLAEGRVEMEGPSREVAGRDEVRKAYLGL